MSFDVMRIKDISKSFPGTQALTKVNIDFHSNEVHVLLGENGAGKSTLIKIISGVYQRDSGIIEYKGEPVNFTNPKQAKDAGINVIHQELSLIPDLSVAENIFLNREIYKGNFSFLDKKLMNKKARESLDLLDVDINPSTKVRDLNTANQQMVEIARAIYWNASIIIMDEPTSSLSDSDVNKLFKIIKKLKKKDICIIYITHRINEIIEIGDRVSILRDGSLIKTLPVKDTDKDYMISLMAGKKVDDFFKKEKKNLNEVIFKVNNFSNPPDYKNISFDLRRGEILGIAGLVGAGKTELLKGIFGDESYSEGDIILYNNDIKFSHPQDAINNSFGFVPEDRRTEGILLNKCVKDNIALPMIKQKSKLCFTDKKWERNTAEVYIKKLNIKTPNMYSNINNLSGGNQQKVILARWLAARCKILLLDDPTRGIDIAAKSEIHNLMDEFTKEGGSILLVSSELPELLALADRIIVMREGVIRDILDRDKANKEKIMKLATTEEVIN